MWQSQVEIEHYSVACFDCITTIVQNLLIHTYYVTYQVFMHLCCAYEPRP